jgi:hypothetical protein
LGPFVQLSGMLAMSYQQPSCHFMIEH